VVLLQTLADGYLAAGEPALAGGLLRRAVVHADNFISASHLDAILRARTSLAELAISAGAPLEEAVQLLVAVAAAPGGLFGDAVSPHLSNSIRESKATAAAAAVRCLRKLGRHTEADALEQRFK
jgi:hypothetical protein